MLCDECGKNKATVHLTEIVNEQITKLNLCETCAKEKGSEMEQHFGIADLLAGLSDAETASTPAETAASTKLKCSRCGMAYEDFKKLGRLGCHACYVSFKPRLAPLLKRIHGANHHMGKSPNPEHLQEVKVVSKVREELEVVKAALEKAVKAEEFEEAAALRDKIKFLEKKMNKP